LCLTQNLEVVAMGVVAVIVFFGQTGPIQPHDAPCARVTGGVIMFALAIGSISVQ
jgi:hypothetical protein